MSLGGAAESGIRPGIDLRRRITVALSYYVGRLSRRDRRLWVFGNAKGFADNTRYLAEHVQHEHHELAAWWLAGSASDLDAARAAGLNAVLRGTDVATRIQRRAGAAFLTNGFHDLEAPHLGGAFVVDLGHGKGLKRILLDMPDADAAGSRPGARLRRWLRGWLTRFRLSKVDMIVAQGEWAGERYAGAYRLPRERVRVLGTPRFDVIQRGPAYERLNAGKLRSHLGVAEDDHLVLWLPTWRDAGDASWLPDLDAATLEQALKGTRARLLVKPHPFSDRSVYRARLPDHPRLILLGEGDYDANVLLTEADALVTDFSSAAFDFAILNRPIHFLVPDANEYRGGTGLYEPLDRITGGAHHVAWEPLLAEIRDAALGRNDAPLASAARIRDLSRDRDEPGSSERIVQAVKSALDEDA